jgi:nucleoside-diphosphate-sugar epimerase
MKFTIFGYKGFIGSHIINYLENQKISFDIVNPDNEEVFKKEMGHVIYSIGLTGDFRKRPYDTVEAHVCLLKKILSQGKFESFLYLSSTRVYLKSQNTHEDSELIVNPNEFDDIYNISKILGESICIATNKKNIRIARISNVVGEKNNSDNLIGSIIHDIKNSLNEIQIEINPESEKDYIHIDDVITLLMKISLEGKEKIYNVASGNNIKIKNIATEIQKIVNIKFNFSENAEKQSFKKINIKKIEKEFNFTPTNILQKLQCMLNDIK